MQNQLITSICRQFRCLDPVTTGGTTPYLPSPRADRYAGNLTGMTVAAWTLALPSCPRRARCALVDIA
ncbi:hypothetical protein [Sphingomonas sp. UYP23]